ncbi:transglutaminase domain-containing protein, partial [Micromonospora sp. NPDC004336]
GAAAPAPAAVRAGAAGDGPADGRRMVVLADADRARADAHAAWDELLDTLVDYRVRVDRTETPRATADRLSRETLTADAEATTAVRLLGRAEERARYARDPLTGEPLLPALRAVRGALAARADRRARLMAAVLPPSVLLSWRNAATDASSRLLAARGRGRSRLMRWNPRRLLTNRMAR